MKMKKGYIMDGNRIADCKQNIARMSIWELTKFHLPRSADVTVDEVRRLLLILAEPLWRFVASIWTMTIALPLFLVLWPLIAATKIRLARRFVARMEAEKMETCSIEVYRMDFKRFEGRRFKCWAYNVIIDSFGLHQLLGIPSFDYARRDRQTGDMVYYRLKKDSKEVSNEVEKPEEA